MYLCSHLLDVCDLALAAWARGDVVPEAGVSEGRGEGRGGARADRVLHIQRHQPLPRQDVIVQTVEYVNLQHKTFIRVNKWNRKKNKTFCHCFCPFP